MDDAQIVLLILAFIPVVNGSCEFPHFLRRPSVFASGADGGPSGSQAVWYTQNKYKPRTTLLESQLEINVRATNFVVKLKLERTCSASAQSEQRASEVDGDGEPVSSHCHQRELLYDRRCVKETGENKFIVLHTDVSRAHQHFICMKFVARSSNVVQVWQGSRSGILLDECSDQMLKRDEWLWLAPLLTEYHFCSLVGGFDFWIINTTTNQRDCYMEWHSSRLESECVPGEGIVLSFSHDHCSPFDDRRRELRLHCWASWNEDGQQILVAAEEGKLTQFVLILPLARVESSFFKVQLLFNPRCPVDGEVLPENGFDHSRILMDLQPSEPGLCYDESHLCAGYARKEKCSKNGLYLYANKCKKSCGICNLLPTAKPECHFSSDVIGEWVFFETDRKEKATITSGHVKLETLGEYVCKSKHWNINYYKALSYYSNGCRPRYTCIRVEREMDDTLRFQLGHSSLADNSFELCQFKDDPPPLGKRIHSAEPKILLPWSKVRSDTCGLLGRVGVVTRADSEGRLCQGTLSDWDSEGTCSSQARLRLQLRGNCAAVTHRLQPMRRTHPPPHHPTHVEEFVCIAYVTIAEGFALLLTKSTIRGPQDRLLCWIIDTHPGQQSDPLWRELQVLEQAQCGHESDLYPGAVKSFATLNLTVTSDVVERKCTASGSTIKLNMTHSEIALDAVKGRQGITDDDNASYNFEERMQPNLSHHIGSRHIHLLSFWLITIQLQKLLF